MRLQIGGSDYRHLLLALCAESIHWFIDQCHGMTSRRAEHGRMGIATPAMAGTYTRDICRILLWAGKIA